MTIELDGWRIHVVEGQVAIDNKPTVEVAKRVGEIQPEPVNVVIPAQIIVTAFAAVTNRHGA